MNSSHDTCHPFDCAGVYEIHVVGQVDVSHVDHLAGMVRELRTESDGSDAVVTVLTGWLPDQATLIGVLNTLYDHHYTLAQVRVVATGTLALE